MKTYIWKVVTGCTEISPGCDSCISAALATQEGKSFAVKTHWDQLKVPDKLDQPSTLMVAHGSDLFHDQVSDEFIKSVFATAKQFPDHFFEIITKRSERALYLAPRLPWPSNVLLGFPVTTKGCLWRLDALRKIPAKLKFLSICPILEPLGELDLTGIDVVGVSEETWGPQRKIDKKHIKDIERQCKEQGVEFILQEEVQYSEEACLV